MRYRNSKTGAVVDSRTTLAGAWVSEDKWAEADEAAVAAEKAAAAEETVTTGRKRTKKKSTEA